MVEAFDGPLTEGNLAHVLLLLKAAFGDGEWYFRLTHEGHSAAPDLPALPYPLNVSTIVFDAITLGFCMTIYHDGGADGFSYGTFNISNRLGPAAEFLKQGIPTDVLITPHKIAIQTYGVAFASPEAPRAFPSETSPALTRHLIRYLFQKA